MKNIIIVLGLAVLLCACNDVTKQLDEKIAGADSIAINYFKNDGKMDTVIAVKIIRDKNQMEELASLIKQGSASLKTNCTYDGSIHFFKNDRVVQDVFFNNTNRECAQFSFVINGKTSATALPEAAAAFLTSIKNK